MKIDEFYLDFGVDMLINDFREQNIVLMNCGAAMVFNEGYGNTSCK